MSSLIRTAALAVPLPDALSQAPSLAGALLRGSGADATTTATTPDAGIATEGGGDRGASSAGASSSSSSSSAAAAPLVNVQTFLKDCSDDRTLLLRFRMMSSMSEQAYYCETITADDVWRRYGLELVTSSVEYRKSRSSLDEEEGPNGMGGVANPMAVFEEGDGMATPISGLPEAAFRRNRDATTASLGDKTAPAASAQQAVMAHAEGGGDADALRASTPQFAEEAKGGSSALGVGEEGEEGGEGRDAKQSEAVSVSIAAAQRALEAAKSLTTLLPFANGNGAKREDQDRDKPPKINPESVSPCEWFVADDPKRPHTRYIALQGSDSIDHWVTNLSFDPVDFEEGALGSRIHSGVYKAADKLCNQLIAAVCEHVDLHGEAARFVFTGHSLGGAIGMALVMMLIHRKVMEPEMLEGVYTYGCPAFICEQCACDAVEAGVQASSDWDNGGKGEGRDDSAEGARGGQAADDAAGAGASANCGCGRQDSTLLDRLGIDKRKIKHLCMHRDIVPRAFACDYSPVKNILGKMESFKNHRCLEGSQGKCLTPSLYQHVGDVYFMQPNADLLTFAKPEGYHPLFPDKQGLYRMVEPHATVKIAMDTVNMISRMLQNEWAFGESPAAMYDYATNKEQAIVEILNNPHPLEILKDTAAYGHHGAVSRFHKPKNYTRALGSLLYMDT